MRAEHYFLFLYHICQVSRSINNSMNRVCVPVYVRVRETDRKRERESKGEVERQRLIPLNSASSQF